MHVIIMPLADTPPHWSQPTPGGCRPAAGQQLQQRRVGCVPMLRPNQRSVSVFGFRVQARASRDERAAALDVAKQRSDVQRCPAILSRRIHLDGSHLLVARQAQQQDEAAQVAVLSGIESWRVTH